MQRQLNPLPPQTLWPCVRGPPPLCSCQSSSSSGPETSELGLAPWASELRPM